MNSTAYATIEEISTRIKESGTLGPDDTVTVNSDECVVDFGYRIENGWRDRVVSLYINPSGVAKIGCSSCLRTRGWKPQAECYARAFKLIDACGFTDGSSKP